MFRTHFRRWTVLLVLLIVAGGCSKGGLARLRGVVKLDGRPLANASVLFISQEPGGRDALGSTDADGVFRLSTFKPADGAFPGKYKVVVQPATEADADVVVATPAEAMQAGMASRKRNRPSVTIPPRYSDPGQTILVQQVPASEDVVFELQSK